MSQGTTVRFTYDDYLLLPEESRYEIIDGDLRMSPAPTARHQRIVREIVLILAEFVRRHDLGEVMVSPFDVILSETDVVQPDILFVTKDRASIIREKGAFGAPDLVIEILSPATANRDRTVKAKLYAGSFERPGWLPTNLDRSCGRDRLLTAPARAPSRSRPGSLMTGRSGDGGQHRSS